jgi:hypothetical protein
LRWNGAAPAALADAALAHAQTVKDSCASELLRTPGAVGVGVGRLPSGTPALVVNLAAAPGANALDVPAQEIDDVPVVLQETGRFQVLSNTHSI